MKISVIVPTLNESLILGETLAGIARLNPHEVIVVDGGSADMTVSIARRMATRVIESPKGRARQMNAGAREATGDLLLFLHADSRLNRKSHHKMIKTMRSGEHVG
ncbi:glycosyl transferase family 2, partial [Candidatus Nitromaritima sp. SCGC AAA799-A02]